MSAPWHLTAAEMDAVWDEREARLAEATELLARAEDDLSEWERIHGSDPQTTRLRLEITGFRAADSADVRQSWHSPRCGIHDGDPCDCGGGHSLTSDQPELTVDSPTAKGG